MITLKNCRRYPEWLPNGKNVSSFFIWCPLEICFRSCEFLRVKKYNLWMMLSWKFSLSSFSFFFYTSMCIYIKRRPNILGHTFKNLRTTMLKFVTFLWNHPHIVIPFYKDHSDIFVLYNYLLSIFDIFWYMVFSKLVYPTITLYLNTNGSDSNLIFTFNEFSFLNFVIFWFVAGPRVITLVG